MQTHRILSGATIFLMLVLVVAGWFLVAQPQLAAAATANSQLATVQSGITATEGAIAGLKAQQKDLPKFEKQLIALRKSIPDEAETSAFIDGINALAANAGVTVTALTISDAVAYTPPAAPAGAAAPAPKPSASPSASAAPVAPVAPTAWSPTSDPSITAANFVAIPVSITTNGDWNGTLAFFHGLQSGGRLFLISGFDTAQADAGLITAHTTGFIYVLLDPKAAALDKAMAAASPSPTPTPTPAPTVSPSPNPSGSSTPTPTTSPTP